MLLQRLIFFIVCNIVLYEETCSRKLPPILRKAMNVLWYDKPAHAVKRMVTFVENEGMRAKSLVNQTVHAYQATRKLAQKRVRKWWKNFQASIKDTRKTVSNKLKETRDLYWDPLMVE
ncbi:unnamed protein product [Arctia plantaginis]|uniref:Uncharacterized protein n=1 Tax=Arctia plantaginis TaxID=874455 RepID=A0A8S1BJ10_ARCPL|nr:unnamed protein product [Arctia plantaginis]CAB3257101.1 unnamed protein product [Arctia plantaginis]